MAKDSGVINLSENIISYKSEFYGEWQISLDDVTLIGEYTNDQGPFLDDWFVVFFIGTTKEWYEASNYSEGIRIFKEKLFVIKGYENSEDLYSDLSGSTDYDSFILWPRSICGKKVFDFKLYYPNWWSRLLCMQRVKFDLSKEVERYFSKE